MIFIVYFIICGFFIALQALFSGSEIAFISSDLFKLRHKIQRKDKQAQTAYELITNPEKFLATTLVGANISVTISSSLATLLLIQLGTQNSALWITFIFTPIIVVFAELVPKNIARFYREKFSCKVAGIIKSFEIIFSPLVKLIESLSRILVKILVGKKRHRSLFVTKEEIKSILKEVQSQGLLDRGETEAIEDVFGFKEDKIKDVTTLLRDVLGLDYADSKEIILKKAKKCGFTRYPVFKNKEVVGFINIFDLFYREGEWTKYIRTIIRVGESQKLYDVFTTMRTKKANIALVMRGKKVLGIVTLEDIMREIIASIIKY